MPKRKIDPETGDPLLTNRENRLVDGYIANGGNGARAAVDAGYSPNYADRAAYKVLSRPPVQELIQARIQARISEARVDPNEVIGSLASQMRADVTDCFGPDGGFSIDLARQHGLGHLLKVSTTIHRKCEDGIMKVTGDATKIEFLSPQAAATQLFKVKPNPMPDDDAGSKDSWVDDRRVLLEQLITSTMEEYPDMTRAEVIEEIRAVRPAAAELIEMEPPSEAN